jgi:hypothetical protein
VRSEESLVTSQADVQRQAEEVFCSGSVRETRELPGQRPGTLPKGEDCCFTAIRFKKLYPANFTVTLTTDTGRTVTRRFTDAKTTRTGYIKPSGDDEDDDNLGQAVSGGLGRCVDVDVATVDTASAQLVTVHYRFRLCCDDGRVRNGARLTQREPPALPGGQAVKLPLLEITGVQRAPCP